MQSIFGKIFICDDAPTAKTLSQKEGGFVCVTRQGDKYDPRGLLSGGSNEQVDKLKKVQEYLEKNKVRKQTEKAIYDLREESKTLKE